MSSHTIETAMNTLLSALMVVFFVILAPLWTLFYGVVLLRDAATGRVKAVYGR